MQWPFTSHSSRGAPLRQQRSHSHTQLIVATGKARGPWVSEVLPRLGSSLPGVFLQGLLIADADGATLYNRCVCVRVTCCCQGQCWACCSAHTLRCTVQVPARCRCPALHPAGGSARHDADRLLQRQDLLCRHRRPHKQVSACAREAGLMPKRCGTLVPLLTARPLVQRIAPLLTVWTSLHFTPHTRLLWYKEPTPEPVGDLESHLLGRVEVCVRR
jgi:hypothetical protein